MTRTQVTEATAKLMGKHRQFFVRLESVFMYLSDVTPDSVLGAWKVEELRLHRSVVRFLQEVLGLCLSPQAKVDQVEADRLIAIRQRCRRETWEPLITGYATWLAGRPLRTQRLYLGVAEKFARARRLTAEAPWGAPEFVAYLRAHPGSRASLSPLAKYAREVLHREVRLPSVDDLQARPASYPRTVRDLRKLLNEIAGLKRAGKSPSLALMERVIAKALGFTLEAFQGQAWTMVREQAGLRLIAGTESVHIPTSMESLVEEWHALREGARDP